MFQEFRTMNGIVEKKTCSALLYRIFWRIDVFILQTAVQEFWNYVIFSRATQYHFNFCIQNKHWQLRHSYVERQLRYSARYAKNVVAAFGKWTHSCWWNAIRKMCAEAECMVSANHQSISKCCRFLQLVTVTRDVTSIHATSDTWNQNRKRPRASSELTKWSRCAFAICRLTWPGSTWCPSLSKLWLSYFIIVMFNTYILYIHIYPLNSTMTLTFLSSDTKM